MNADQVEIFGTLRSRIKEIVKALDEEKENNRMIQEEYEQLKSRFEQQNKDYKELEQKYNNLKLAKVLANEGDESHDARIKVNRIVREIDKCIALLNR